MGATSYDSENGMTRERDAAALRPHFFAKAFMYQRFGNRREPLSGVKIDVAPGEFIDSITRRFKKIVQASEILTDARRHQYFVGKGERRRIKSRKARARVNRSPTRARAHLFKKCTSTNSEVHLDKFRKLSSTYIAIRPNKCIGKGMSRTLVTKRLRPNKCIGEICYLPGEARGALFALRPGDSRSSTPARHYP